MMNNEVTVSIDIGSDLADYEGYEFYDTIQKELSEKFYGIDGIYDKNSYLYKYMEITYGSECDTSSKLVDKFNDDSENYIKAAKLSFEEKVSNGDIKIDINHDGKNIVLNDISEYNREYAGKYSEIKKIGINTGYNTNLNAVVIDTGSEKVGFIEGSNSKQDFEDWIVNVEMAKNFSKESGSTPDVYIDGWEYIKKYNEQNEEKITKVVGNSQGGGTAIYIGMQDPNIEVVAISPAPQYIGDVDKNGSYPNITVIYPSGDPLYNLTKNLGYEVEIPGANIVYVEYGLNKLYEFGKGGGNILSFDLHAAHTGNVSAVDYNSDGKIDDFEENLGLYIDDVIPRSVFTGREIGSNTVGGEVLEMSSEHMNNFADYLKMLHQNYMPEIIDRNTLANSNNEDKIADSSTCKTNFCEKVVSDTVNSTENLVKYIDSSTGFVNNIILKGIDASLNIRLALTGTNGKYLPKTEKFLEAARDIIRRITEDFQGCPGYHQPFETELADFYNNRKSFIEDFENNIGEVVDDFLQIDYVGHKGTYAIGHTLQGIFEAFRLEQDKLTNECLNLEACTRFIADRFDYVDKAISDSINEKYLNNSMSEDDEMIYESQDNYINYLALTENMNVIEQFETLVDEGVELIRGLIAHILDQLVYFANIMIKYESELNDIFDYESVYMEINGKKNEEKEIFGGWYDGIVDKAAREILKLIEETLRPNSDQFELAKEALESLPALVADAENFKSALAEYIEPSIESLLYDSFDLSLIRDSLTLNSQVLFRMNTEINQACETLDGEVQFMGKDALKELVKELGLRINALSTLHQDVFGDCS